MAASKPSAHANEVHIPASYLNIAIQLAAFVFVAGIGWNTISNLDWRVGQLEERYTKQIEELELRQERIITQRAEDRAAIRERLTRMEVTLNSITAHLEKIAGRIQTNGPLRPSYLPEQSNR